MYVNCKDLCSIIYYVLVNHINSVLGVVPVPHLYDEINLCSVRKKGYGTHLVLNKQPFSDVVMPENLESMWGPIPLGRLPHGALNHCTVANHTYVNFPFYIYYILLLILCDGSMRFSLRVPTVVCGA